MGSYLYLMTGACLLTVGGGVLLAQSYLWLTAGAWVPARLGALWELAGISGPLGGLSLAGVLLVTGGWLLREGVRRGKRLAEHDRRS